MLLLDDTTLKDILENSIVNQLKDQDVAPYSAIKEYGSSQETGGNDKDEGRRESRMVASPWR